MTDLDRPFTNLPLACVNCGETGDGPCRCERIGRRMNIGMALVFVPLFFYAQLSRPQTPVIQEFKNATGYPHGRPGFVVDHKLPLCAGGPDVIDNLQWQELRKSYQKDAFERQLCAEMKRQGYRLVKQEQK